MKNKIIKLAVIPAILVFLLSYIFINKQIHTIAVPVAKRNIQSGEIVKEDDLTELKLPFSTVPNGVITDKNQVVGRRVSVSRIAGDFFYNEVFRSTYVELGEDETLIYVNIPGPLSNFISQDSMLIIATTNTSGSDIPIYAIDDAQVVAIVAATSGGVRTNTSDKFAIVKVKKDQAIQFATACRTGEYTVILKR